MMENQHTPLLYGNNLTYKIGNKTILEDVSIALNTGELVTIIGPNGAGKSSLLRLLTGYTPRHKENVFLKGKLTHSGIANY